MLAKLGAFVSMLLCFLFLPLMALAQTPTTEPTDLSSALGYLPTLLNFVKNGQWLLVGALSTLVLVFLIRQYVLPKLPVDLTGWLPILSAVLGVLVGVGGAILSGSTGEAALLAVASGPAASALWSALLKHFFPTPVDQAI